MGLEVATGTLEAGCVVATMLSRFGNESTAKARNSAPAGKISENNFVAVKGRQPNEHASGESQSP